MKNKFILFLCFYLASAVLVLGLILPHYNTARQAVSNDNAIYEKDSALQVAHDNWLKSDEAAQIQQHNYDLNVEYAEKQANEPNYYEANGLPNLYLDIMNSPSPPSLIDLDTLAWEKAGGAPSFNWQENDSLQLCER